MSVRNISTTIIGPKGVLRDSLASLLDSYSYRVTECHQSTADMAPPAEGEDIHMVILTMCSVDAAIAECERIKRSCSNCKIIGLLENISSDDVQKLLHSMIDACVPLEVSQDVLNKTLDLVMSGSERIVVLADGRHVPSPPASSPRKTGSGSNGNGQVKDDGSAPKSTPTPSNVSQNDACAGFNTASRESTGRDQTIATSPINRCGAAARLLHHTSAPGIKARHADALGRPPTVVHFAEFADARAPVSFPSLSVRERQIVDGLVKGLPNKIIARACGITEATVKVHMKAILRKVPCSNRTQVAIWALAHPDAVRATATNGAIKDQHRFGGAGLTAPE